MRPPLLTILIISLLPFISCNKDDDNTKDNDGNNNEDHIIRIPVVVHVVNYKPDPFTISDEKIQSQIDILNQDFRKKNPDYIKTPDEFIDLVADIGIEFYLATTDPDGNPTTGIIRTESNITAFNSRYLDDSTPVEDMELYFTDKGGQDAWPNNTYLNIWIGDMNDRSGDLALPGYARFPGSDPRIDGVVISPKTFGTIEPLHPNHRFGRTTTHEIGHWLGLIHIFGENNNCEVGDLVDDTPTQYAQYKDNPTHPQSSCGSNDMFMNFMDYVNDESMVMFTNGQKERIHQLFAPGGTRRSLYLKSKINRKQ